MTNRKQSSSLVLAVLLLVQTVCALTCTRADDYQLPTSSGDRSSSSGDGTFGRHRFTATFDSRFGYDDNPLAQPDTETIVVTNPLTGAVIIDPKTGAPRTRNVDVNHDDSAFLNFSLGVGYTAANPRLTLVSGADVGVNYYFDRPGRSYDVNGGLSLRLTYKLTPRLLLEASTYDAYESAGDYGATTLTNFTGEFSGGTRTPGTSAERDGDYFYSTNFISASYQVSPRMTAILSDTFIAFAYEDEPYITDQDRIENYVQAEFNYHLQPTLSLAADYRFGYVGYFNVDNDSGTHFLLGGVDYTFNPRLSGSFRAGVEFRSYFDTPGDEISPYFEGNISYQLNRRAQLLYVAHYGIEEGDLSASNSKSDTFRTGVNYEQNFTARISGYLGFYYTHSFNSTPVPDATTRLFNASGFDEDTFDVAAGARYSINRHLSAEIGYTYTTVISQVDIREYDRNRVFAGIRLAY